MACPIYMKAKYYFLHLFKAEAMIAIKESFVTDDKGKKVAVLLPIKDYKKILEELDELEDIRMYDEVKKRNEGSIPFEQYLKQRKKKKAL